MSDDPRRLLHGGGVPQDRSHTEILPSGMQKDYIVLSAEERAKGFVKPVRRSYIHRVCGTMTTMGRELSETYARDPHFYSGTFCCHCGKHFDLEQFDWEDGEPMDTTEQPEWAEKQRVACEERRQRRITELRRELAELEGQPESESEVQK